MTIIERLRAGYNDSDVNNKSLESLSLPTVTASNVTITSPLPPPPPPTTTTTTPLTWSERFQLTTPPDSKPPIILSASGNEATRTATTTTTTTTTKDTTVVSTTPSASSSPFVNRESFEYFRNCKRQWKSSPRHKIQPIEFQKTKNDAIIDGIIQRLGDDDILIDNSDANPPIVVTSTFSFHDDENENNSQPNNYTTRAVSSPTPIMAKSLLSSSISSNGSIFGLSYPSSTSAPNVPLNSKQPIIATSLSSGSAFSPSNKQQNTTDFTELEGTDSVPSLLPGMRLQNPPSDTSAGRQKRSNNASTATSSSSSKTPFNTPSTTPLTTPFNTPFNTPFSLQKSTLSRTDLSSLTPFPSINEAAQIDIPEMSEISNFQPSFGNTTTTINFPTTNTATGNNSDLGTLSTFKSKSSTSSQFDQNSLSSSFLKAATQSNITYNSHRTLSPEARQLSKTPNVDDHTITTTASYRDRVIEFYTKYNPDKLDQVDSTLDKFKGKEEEMFAKLKAKYLMVGAYLKPHGTGPICFLDFGPTFGRVTIQLFADKVPLATENFRCLCTGEKGHSRRSGKLLCYKDCQIHRIVPNMCIQGGDFTVGDGTGGESIYPPGLPYTDMWGKFHDDKPFMVHDRPGLLSMANTGPNRNGSQFFITLKALPHLNGKHVVFGIVIDGMNIVETIGTLATNPKQRPLEPITIVDCGEIKKNPNGTVTEIRASTNI